MKPLNSTISLYLPKAKWFLKLSEYSFSNYASLVLSNLWDLRLLKYDAINQNSLQNKDAAYRYHHNTVLLTKDLRLIVDLSFQQAEEHKTLSFCMKSENKANSPIPSCHCSHCNFITWREWDFSHGNLGQCYSLWKLLFSEALGESPITILQLAELLNILCVTNGN